MSTRVRCPSCQTVFSMTDPDEGGEVFCPNCDKRLMIPRSKRNEDRDEEKRPSPIQSPVRRPEAETSAERRAERRPRPRRGREENWERDEEDFAEDRPPRGRRRALRRPAKRSPLLWVAVSVGVLVLLVVVVIAAILIEGVLNPRRRFNQAAVAGGPPQFINQQPIQIPGFLEDPQEAAAAVRENLIPRLPALKEDTFEIDAPPLKEAPAQTPLPGDIPPATVQKVERSTVHLRVQGGDGISGEGTGFFAAQPGLVITNAHVLGMLRPGVSVPKRIDVTLFSGEPNEKKLSGTVLGVDRSADLAVVRVPTSADLPPPLLVRGAKELTEVQKVYIFGFPFGSQLGKQITVSVSTISQLRKDRLGKINRIQVNGGMHPGNSGGPVVDARGDVIGVSVAVIQFTQINFAIPGDHVLAALRGRVLSVRTGSPYKNGAKVEMSYEVNLLDPLRNVRGAKVEYWWGPAGGVRPAARTQPAPLKGDDPHQVAELSYKSGVARGDLLLPAASLGKTLYLRPVLVNAAGETTWTAARPSRLPPLIERQPALLAWKNEPAVRKVLVDTTSRLHYSGQDTEWRVEAHLEEKLQPAAQGANVRLVHKRVRVGPYANNTWAQDVRQVAQAARSMKDTESAGAVDAAGSPEPPRHQDQAPRNFLVRKDINDIHQQFAHAFALASVALPNRLVKPMETWPAERTIVLGGTTVTIDLVCTYEGTRKRGEREEAVIRIAGKARAEPGQAKPPRAEARGEAIFDLIAGQISFARLDVDLSLEFAVPGRGNVPASGSVIAKLTRSTANVPTQYHQVFRVDDKLTANEPKDRLQPGYSKVFKVRMKAGQTYLISMMAKIDPAAQAGAPPPALGTAFDPYLRLEDARGETLAEDDDSGGGMNAQILFQPLVDGDYQIVATTFGADQVGGFVLTVDEE